MAHNEYNRPRGSGMILIAIGILIFVFAPGYVKSNTSLGVVAAVIGFLLGGVGFYISFIKKRKN
ncbi:MAG TPA: hypothetical protein VEJ68_02745 [Candidatus Bathyarchaeia archaeon]|nr:hypothetical protein [Candidatus Bathyarchaeia archaeon]